MTPLSFIAGILLFTNSLSFTTNSLTGFIIHQDSIFGTNQILSLNLDSPVKDTEGNPLTQISTNGVYTLIAPDGWGYQQFIQLPRDTTNFNSYVPGSLAYQCVTNTQARTNGLTPASEAMFSTASWSTTNFVRNPNFWLAFAPEKTAIVIGQGNPLTGEIGDAAVSPRHVINCAHAPFGVGNKLLFIDDNGSDVWRTVMANKNYGYPGSDINVALLDSDLPSTVNPFKILPTKCVAWLPTLTNSPTLHIVAANQDKKVFPKLLGKSPWDSILLVNSSALWLGTNWNVTIRSGDSGHALMLLVGTNLVLLSHWTSAGSGTFYSYPTNFTLIDAGMHYLSTNNDLSSDYQLSTVNLSAFPTY